MARVEKRGAIEKLSVYIRYGKNGPYCICMASNKTCSRRCSKEIVLRDRFYGWEQTFNRNKFGKDYKKLEKK